MGLAVLILVLLGLAFPAVASGFPIHHGDAARDAPLRWQESRALGLPWEGRLVRGVQLPAEGIHFFTWDPGRDRSPNRPWRRFGTDRLVRIVLRVVNEYAAEHPNAPRVGLGDLSRPRGGDFSLRFGRPGHVSHQNGLDIDVYYPRKDGRELEPKRPRLIDRRLAQDLVDRFVRAGAQMIFVGPRTGLSGPPGIVQPLSNHDNHLHVRLFPSDRPVRRQVALGRSALGRPIQAIAVGRPESTRKVLVVGCIHGDECAGIPVVRRLARGAAPRGADLWLVPNLNPDGFAAGTRQNGRGVDLNRNFPSEWRASGQRWDPQYPGPRPLSEPEARLARSLILRLRPKITIWFHQPQALVRAWGGSVEVAAGYARLAKMTFRRIRWPAGTAPNWQNHRFPRAASFVVELPPGPLAATAAGRHAAAIRRLAAA
jgi:hypothetical protein